jgi:threonine dehydrogenase-like Zn-dependent dehydrogenase
MTEPGRIEIRSHELPTAIEPGGVLLRVLQTNVCGSDIHIFEGRHPLLRCGGMGHEMVGRVARLGPGVTTDSAGVPVATGDRVVPVYTSVCHACENCDRGVTNHCDHAFKYFGRSAEPPFFQGATFATHYYLRADQPFYRVPDAVSTPGAASANCALAQVLHGLDKVGVGLDQWVVIQGAGGLGLSATAVAKERGARVVVLDMVADRLELARSFGADHVIDVSRMTSLDDRVRAVQRLARTQGADVVIELTGVPAVFSEGLSYLRPEGTYLVMGTISPGHKAEFDPGVLVRKSARVIGVNRYPGRYLREAMSFLEAYEAKYPFGRLLSRPFRLEEAQKAIEMSARREVQRATLVPDEDGPE